MKLKLILGIFLSLTRFSFSATAVVDENMTGNFKFKSDKGEVEVTDKNYKNLKMELKYQVSGELDRLILGNPNSFDIVLAVGDNGEKKIVFKTTQLFGPPLSKKTDDKDVNDLKVRYRGEAKDNGQNYSITCYEKTIDVKDSVKQEVREKQECLKKDKCQSFAVKDKNTIETTETPVCIGKKTVTLVPKKIQIVLTCAVYDAAKEGDPKSMKLTQVLAEKETKEIKKITGETTSSATCQ